MADPVYLGAFAGVRDLSWGAAPKLAIFHGTGASGPGRSRVQVHDRTGRYLGTRDGLADLLPSGPGEVTGLAVSADGQGLALFRQSTARPFIQADARGLAGPWGAAVRLMAATADGQRPYAALANDALFWRLGPVEQQAPSHALVAPTVVRDPGDGTALGLVEGGAGVAELDGHILVGVTCPALPDAQGRAPLALETTDLWASHRLVEAEGPLGDGPVGWRTSAVAAWRGFFWMVSTRTTAGADRHRLYRSAPGGAARLVSETGWVDRTGALPRPRGLMVRAPQDDPAPLAPSGHGGLWAGDRLVMGAARCAATSSQGLCLAGGGDGLLVLDDPEGLPLFRGAPMGHLPLAARPLGGEGEGGERGGGRLAWLCRTRAADGTIGSALTEDFLAWTLDPFPGDPPIPGGATSTHRWGALGFRGLEP